MSNSRPNGYQPRPDVPTLDELTERMRHMPEHAVRMTLFDILLQNEQARRQFHESPFTQHDEPPAAQLAAEAEVYGIGEEDEEDEDVEEDNEFQDIVTKVERAIHRQINVQEPDRKKEDRIENTVEKAIKSIGIGCAATLLDDSVPDAYGGYVVRP